MPESSDQLKQALSEAAARKAEAERASKPFEKWTKEDVIPALTEFKAEMEGIEQVIVSNYSAHGIQIEIDGMPGPLTLVPSEDPEFGPCLLASGEPGNFPLAEPKMSSWEIKKAITDMVTHYINPE